MKKIGKLDRRRRAGVCVAGGIVSGQELSELSLPPGGNGVSQRAEVSQWIGPVKVTIGYHSPNVHGRGADRTDHIWGELIPYGLYDEGFGPTAGTPWRAGANESTTITFSHDVRVEGSPSKPARTRSSWSSRASGPWSWILSRQARLGKLSVRSRRTRSRRSRPRRRRLPTRNSSPTASTTVAPIPRSRISNGRTSGSP